MYSILSVAGVQGMIHFRSAADYALTGSLSRCRGSTATGDPKEFSRSD
jgi:hypothetical protein